ncbi:MAG: hypothetical protein CMJ58_27420 [Planctomycetaceae bacterium]|nr:hypothetical protein [Planctomycetaceae bacterium]
MNTDDNGVRRLRRLLSQIIDQTANDQEFAELAALLAERPELHGEYLRMMQAEAALDELYARMQASDVARLGEALAMHPSDVIAGLAAPPSEPNRRTTPAQPSRPGRLSQLTADRLAAAGRRAWWALAAALLIAAFGYAVWPRSYGTLVAANDALWKSGSHCELGQALSKQWLELEAGAVQIAFRSAAVMKIEGPARFRLDGPGRCQLESGSGLAYVPVAARGFIVNTPTMHVVDLGTSFRVEVDDDGTTNLHVLEGVVEAAALSDDRATRLGAGEIAVVAAGGESGLQASGRESAFVRTSPRIAFRAKHPPALGPTGFRGDNRAYVFLERCNFTLPYDLSVNCATTGRHVQFGDIDGRLPAGERVDCYLIHSAPARKRHAVEGTVIFEGEILGIVADSDKLNATNDLFGSPWSLHCQHPERGLESIPDKNAELLEISPDRHTLRITMQTESVDQMRVLVRSVAADSLAE